MFAMGLRPASFVTALLTLPTRGSGYVFPSVWCRGYSAHQPSPPAAPHTSCIADTSGRAPTGVRLRRDEIPEENARQIEAADRRVKELEEEYWKSLDAREVAIERKCSSGLACLKMGLLERAAEDYAAANELRWGCIRKGRPEGRHCGTGMCCLLVFWSERRYKLVVTVPRTSLNPPESSCTILILYQLNR